MMTEFMQPIAISGKMPIAGGTIQFAIGDGKVLAVKIHKGDTPARIASRCNRMLGQERFKAESGRRGR